MKMKIHIVLFACLLSSSCSERKQKNDDINNQTKGQQTVAYKDPKQEPQFLDDSLESILYKISLSDKIEKKNIYFKRLRRSANDGRFFYNDQKEEIILTEVFENTNVPTFNKVYINGKIVNYYKSETPSIINSSDISFGNSSIDDSIPGMIYKTPIGEFLQLVGSSVSAEGQFADIMYAFFISLDKCKGFIFSSLNVPDNFYVGYDSSKNKLIYLNISSPFPTDEKSEYQYDITAKYLDVNSFRILPIRNPQGDIYYMELVTPNFTDLSKYRIIKTNWWKY